MLVILRVCCCLVWLLLMCGECLPQQLPDRRGVDGQRPDADTDAPSTGAETRAQPVMEPASSPEGSLDSFSFLRELQAFLDNVFPRPPGEAVSSRMQLQSLKSLPSQALGRASSETLLVGLLNSSSPTFFSFPPPRSVLRLGHGGELALPPHLLEELRRKLGTLEQQVEVLLGEVEVEPMAFRHLERLRALGALPREERPAGEHQYRAFLLMLALQTVAQAYEVQRGLRAARAGQASGPDASNICRKEVYSMQVEKFLLYPCVADIKKCVGVCSFPLHNPTNHAIMINDQIQSGALLDSSVCCVPVAYDSLMVAEVLDSGTHMHVKEDMFVRECGCR